MIPFVTKNQLNQSEAELQRKITPPNNLTINDEPKVFGYIHKVEGTFSVDGAENDPITFYVRLDTSEAIPTVELEGGAEEFRVANQFIFDHLINFICFEPVYWEDPDIADSTVPGAPAIGYGGIVTGALSITSFDDLLSVLSFISSMHDVTNEGE